MLGQILSTLGLERVSLVTTTGMPTCAGVRLITSYPSERLMFAWLRRKAVAPAPPATNRASCPARFPLNVPGPFYTCGNCLACGLPEGEAPELLAPLERGNSTTYFVKQPETAEEVERACMAIRVCCVADLRYGGQDRAIIHRLGNDSGACDFIVRDDRVVPITPGDG